MGQEKEVGPGGVIRETSRELGQHHREQRTSSEAGLSLNVLYLQLFYAGEGQHQQAQHEQDGWELGSGVPGTEGGESVSWREGSLF